MTNSYHNIKIKGVATVVPKNIEENDVNERRTAFTGIERRHVCLVNQTAADLCQKAAESLIFHLKWRKTDVDALVFVTQCPNFQAPSTAFLLHKNLGLKKDCLVFDVNLGCSGYGVGLQTISALLQGTPLGSKGLLLVGDDTPSILVENDRWDEESIRLRDLFGSAGSATAIEVVEQNDSYCLSLSDGTNYSAIIKRKNENLFMDGVKVFDFAIHDVVEGVKTFLKRFRLSDDEIDCYIFHQAQKSIIENVIDLCDLPENKVPTSYKEYGNTSGASLPLTICSHMGIAKTKESVRLFLCGFGVGTSLGIHYTQVETGNILPVMETDAYFDDTRGEWR